MCIRDSTQTLDVPRSVRATVRAGGLAQLRFHAARHTRKVWFWLDDSLADDSPLRRLAQELSVALRRSGLQVEEAMFYGPVSYTHLDVYKRQHLRPPRRRTGGHCSPCEPHRPASPAIAKRHHPMLPVRS